MTSTNIAVVMRRGVTRATALLDPALPLEAKPPQSLRGTSDDRHYPRSPRVGGDHDGASTLGRSASRSTTRPSATTV
jgi:hypothetical protein